MPSDVSIHDMRQAVEKMHGCQAEHVQSTLVHEQMEGQTVWKGQVEIFRVFGHPKADRAFAWAWDDDGELRYIAVLNVPPILTPREAVQAAIASGKQR